MNREFNIACMHAANSTKIKSAKTFLKAFPRNFIPSKYTRYTVFARYGYYVTLASFYSFRTRIVGGE